MPDDSANASLPDPQQMSYEDAIAELESINDQIERGELTLEQSLAAYKRGVALAKRCNAILEVAEQEVKKIKPAADDTDSAAQTSR